ncbi:MAG: hypothetical protein WBG81_03230 [Rhodanobacter sp.]
MLKTTENDEDNRRACGKNSLRFWLAFGLALSAIAGLADVPAEHPAPTPGASAPGGTDRRPEAAA